MVLGRSLQNTKQEKKFKLASRTSGGFSGGNGTLASKEKGDGRSKKVQTGGNGAIGVYHTGQCKVTNKGVFGNRNVKSKINGERRESVTEGNKGFKPLNSDDKRKRIYVDQSPDHERVSNNNVGRSARKFSSRMVQNKLKDHFHEQKRTTKGNSCEFGDLSRKVHWLEEENLGKVSCWAIKIQ